MVLRPSPNLTHSLLCHRLHALPRFRRFVRPLAVRRLGARRVRRGAFKYPSGQALLRRAFVHRGRVHQIHLNNLQPVDPNGVAERPITLPYTS